MYKPYVLPLLLSVVGAILALNALLAPFGNTGVDGTLGASLALVGAIAAIVLLAVTMARPLPAGWFVTLNILAMLAALLTAIAAFFLMQTFLAVIMAATFLAQLFAFLARGRRSQ